MYYPVQVGGPVTKIIDEYVEAFGKAHPNIKVTAVYAGSYAETHTKTLTALRSSAPPHFAVLLAADLHSYIDNDLIVPVDEMLTAAQDKAWLASFYPAFLANSRAKGKVWSVPFQRSTAVMYWNKEAFKEAGLDPEKPPRTWAEMAAMGEKLTKRDASGNVARWGVRIPSSSGGAQWMFGALAYQAGQVLMNEDGTETYLDAPKTVEALQYWLDLSKKYKAQPEGVVEWATVPTAFIEGTAAMIWHTTGNLTFIRERAKFDFGVGQLPGKDGPRSVVGGGNFYVFSSTTPAQRKAALEFMKFVTTPEMAADWSIRTGYVAVRQAAYDTPAMKEYTAKVPAAIVARDQIPVSTAEISVTDNQRVWKILNDSIQSVLTGRATPEAALAAAQQQSAAALKKH
ncbi:MAG: ABC transporter substrate-binding protein [Proteobacteria bacterium]|nr:ABC transporter substrate-binding protein [Pseudomonadota bacterium]